MKLNPLAICRRTRYVGGISLARPLTASFLVVIVALATAIPAANARTGAAPKGDIVAGKRLFRAYCGTCHTLTTAGTIAKGKSRGVNFDRRREPFARVFQVLVEGEGDMRPFTTRLTFKQLRDVAAFLDVATKHNPSSNY